MPKTRAELQAYLEARIAERVDGDVFERETELICYLLENAPITVPNENRFFVTLDCDDLLPNARLHRIRPLRHEIAQSALGRGEAHRAYTGSWDFGHTTADWESVISLGIRGLRDRLGRYAERARTPRASRFFSGAIRVYDSILRMMERAADAAEAAGKTEMATGLRRLVTSPPSTLSEAMQTTLVYYTVQQKVEGVRLRTLGRLDSLYLPYYRKESDQEAARALIPDFLSEIDRLRPTANIPFALLGTEADGTPTENELSRLFLDGYRRLELTDTKLHLLCRRDTSDELLALACRAIREGKNSLILLSDEKVTESLIRLGEDSADAIRYHVVGCYECGGRGELTCSCNARVNLPKAVEYALTGGVDLLTGERIGLSNDGVFPDFDSFLRECVRQMLHLVSCAMECTEHYERSYPMLCAAPVLSSTYPSALESAGDLYVDSAAKYNNSSLNALGLATATDSLAAIRRLVYEEGRLSLAELTEILRRNWEGEETLRLLIKTRFPKYGTGDARTDAVARHLIDRLGDAVNGHPNARGGIWRLGAFSINWRWEFGEQTAASADGRLRGEPLSQNTGASFGCDRNGATAHLRSAASLDNSRLPNGSVVDLDLHSSAVGGEDGLAAMAALLRAYLTGGGFGVHCNVLNADTLREAQRDPSLYPNLQVRLCGWNVRFHMLSRREQDEFIRRAER